jgi:hypothetical protein
MTYLSDLQAKIQVLAVHATKAKVNREAIDCVNIAGLSLDDRIRLGQQVAGMDAEVARTRSLLEEAMREYAGARE